MRFLGASAVLLLLLNRSAFSQTAEELQAAVKGIRCAPLAEYARVQGTVRLDLNRGVVTLRSGHPLLTPVAVGNAKVLAPLLDKGEHSISYHFELAAETSVCRSTTVKRGDRFDRAILRVLGLKTERVTVTWECVEATPPANDIKVFGSAIEVRVHGRVRCLMVDSATQVAKR